jgi:hypothetical protein
MVAESKAGNRYFAFEAEVIGASSGDARFEDQNYNGQQGDLLRSAKLGRVALGGVLRMGMRRYIPVARVGLGLQGASHNAEIEVGGQRMPGPEVGFEFSLLVNIGQTENDRCPDRTAPHAVPEHRNAWSSGCPRCLQSAPGCRPRRIGSW